MYSFSYLEPVCCSMSSSNCCFLTCIQISQEAGQVVWYSHLFQNFLQFIVIHTLWIALQNNTLFFNFLIIITIFYFTILYWFCHTSTCICHCTRVPHPEPPSHLPLHTIPLGHPSTPAPSFLYPKVKKIKNKERTKK